MSYDDDKIRIMLLSRLGNSNNSANGPLGTSQSSNNLAARSPELSSFSAPSALAMAKSISGTGDCADTGGDIASTPDGPYFTPPLPFFRFHNSASSASFSILSSQNQPRSAPVELILNAVKEMQAKTASLQSAEARGEELRCILDREAEVVKLR